MADYEMKSTSMPVFRIGVVGLKMKCRHESECSSVLFLNKGDVHLIQTDGIFGDNHGY